MSKRITQIVLILGLIAMVVAACSFATGTNSDENSPETAAAIVEEIEAEAPETVVDADAEAVAETGENAVASDSAEAAPAEESATNEMTAEETVYTVSPADSEIGWLGDKIVGNELYGAIDVLEGSLIADGDAFVSGSVTIDMTSMVVENLTGSDAERLITHLQTEDFFSVAIYPTATIDLTTVEPLGNDEYAVTGDLTIKGITNPIEFTAQAVVEDGLFTATADVTFDRTLYDVTYKSGSIFSGLGDGAINDAVQMTVSLVAY